MLGPRLPKSFQFSHSFAPFKKQRGSQPGATNLNEIEKTALQRQSMTVEGFEKPPKSCKPQKITSISLHKKPHAPSKAIAIVIAAIVLVVLIFVLLLFCGVFQLTKERVEDKATGVVLEK